MSEVMDELELVVRDALAAEAATYEVPADLARRTLAAARRPARPRRGARPWLITAAVAAALVVLVGVGVVLTDDFTAPKSSPAARSGLKRSDGAKFGDAQQSFTSGDVEQGARSGAVGGDLALGASPTPASPQIARTADVAVQVDRGQFAGKWREANAIAAQHGGFVVDSSATTVRGQLATGHLTARVPVAHLDAVIRDLRELGTPTRVNETGRDVSPQLVDYDARIGNAKAQETQLLQLLSGARTSRAVAEIKGQLDQTRGEIEALQGERAKVQAQVDFATVEATVTEPLNAPKPEPKGSWNKALHRAGDGVVAVLTGLIVAVGYVAPLALLVLVGWQARRRYRRRAIER